MHYESKECTAESHEDELFNAFIEVAEPITWNGGLGVIYDGYEEKTYFVHHCAWSGESKIFRDEKTLKAYLRKRFDMTVKGHFNPQTIG